MKLHAFSLFHAELIVRPVDYSDRRTHILFDFTTITGSRHAALFLLDQRERRCRGLSTNLICIDRNPNLIIHKKIFPNNTKRGDTMNKLKYKIFETDPCVAIVVWSFLQLKITWLHLPGFVVQLANSAYVTVYWMNIARLATITPHTFQLTFKLVYNNSFAYDVTQ